MIQRFEDEYPECRLHKAPSTQPPSDSPSNLSRSSSPSVDASTELTSPTTGPIFSEDDDADDDAAGGLHTSSGHMARHNSDVSLASRALGQEEGEIHRLGQRVRRDILRPDPVDPSSQSSTTSTTTPPLPLDGDDDGEPDAAEHLSTLRAKLEALEGGEIRDKVAREGWAAVMREIGANAEELKRLRQGSPEDWRRFRDAQIMAQKNAGVFEEGDAEGTKDTVEKADAGGKSGV